MEEIGKYHNGSAGHQNDYHNTAGTTPFAKIQNREQEKERNQALYEVGLMQLCKNHDSILRSIEAFEHKERLWIILELMDKGMLATAIEKYA